jgi:hypothetical protein
MTAGGGGECSGAHGKLTLSEELYSRRRICPYPLLASALLPQHTQFARGYGGHPKGIRGKSPQEQDPWTRPPPSARAVVGFDPPTMHTA